LTFTSKSLRKRDYAQFIFLGGVAWGVLIHLVASMAFDVWLDTYWVLALLIGLLLVSFQFLKDYAQYRERTLTVHSDGFEITRPQKGKLYLEKHKLQFVRYVKTYYGFAGKVKTVLYFKNPDNNARTHIMFLINKDELQAFKFNVEGKDSK